MAERNQLDSDLFYTIIHSRALGKNYDHWMAGNALQVARDTYYAIKTTAVDWETRIPFMRALEL